MSTVVFSIATAWVVAVIACALTYSNNRRVKDDAPSIWESDSVLPPAPRWGRK